MSGFSKVQSAGKTEIFGAEVEKIDALETVTDAKGVTVGRNLRLDFETGDVWLRVGALDNMGQQETLPASGNQPAKVVDKLAVVNDSVTFSVGAEHTDKETMHGTFSLWRTPKGHLIQLVRYVGLGAAKAAPTAKMVTKRS
jgi:hypothetical protein